MLHFLALMRWKNLIFIALIQLLITFCLAAPTLTMYSVPMLTPWWISLLIVVGTVCVAAGGYVINDYFDLKIDRINRPDKVLIGSVIEKKSAMRLYQILTAAGVVAGVAAAIALRSLTVGFIFVVVPGMLWFYSASYKRQFLVGNLIVAMSAALTPLLPIIVECGLLTEAYGDLIRKTPIVATLTGWGGGFALFAFLWTLVREIIKDLEDEYGDRELECRTVPIICGARWTKVIVTALVLLTNALLAYFVINKIALPGDQSVTLRYFLVGIVAPSLCLIVILWRRSCTAYHNASTLCKFIMAVGILYCLVYNFLIAKAFHLALFGIFYVA